jgi:hypothetical protein
VWAASDAFRTGDRAVGVRSHPNALSVRIRAGLAADSIEGVGAPANYSLRFQDREPGRKGPVRAYELYRAQCLFLRTRTRTRALRALSRCLSAHADGDAGLLRARQLAVVGPSGAVIVPPELHWRLEALEPRLAEHGLSLVDPPLVEIDRETGELVVAPPGIGAEADWFRARSSRDPRDGRYLIREWAVLGGGEAEAVSPQVALAAVMPLVERDMNFPGVLEGMLRTLSGTRLTRIQQLPPPRLLERLVSVDLS